MEDGEQINLEEEEEEENEKNQVQKPSKVDVLSEEELEKLIVPLYNVEFTGEIVESSDFVIQCFPRLTEWLWRSLLYNSDKVALSPHIFFILLQEFILTEEPELFSVILKYTSSFPDHLIDFSTFLYLLLEAGISSPAIFPHILAIGRIDLFEFTDEFPEKRIQFILLKCFLIAFFKSVNDPPFEFITTFQNLLFLEPNSEEEFSGLSEKFFDEHEFSDLNFKQIERFIYLFPMGGNGFYLFELLSRRLISSFLNLEEKKSLQDFIHNGDEILQKIQGNCRSNDTDQINNATYAVMILYRYCAIVFVKNIESNMKNELQEFLEQISNGLQFLWHGADQLLTTNQRELFHMFSTQLKKLMEIQTDKEQKSLKNEVQNALSHNLPALSQDPPSS